MYLCIVGRPNAIKTFVQVIAITAERMRRMKMKYSGMITIKTDGKESNIYLEFDKDDVYAVMRAYEVILNCAKADEVNIFSSRC